MPGYSVAAVALAALISGSRAFHICGNYCGESATPELTSIHRVLSRCRLWYRRQEQHSGGWAIDVWVVIGPARVKAAARLAIVATAGPRAPHAHHAHHARRHHDL